jgi:hypothetical protein
LSTKKEPTILDFLAGGVIANFIITIWSMTPSDYIYNLLSIPVYTIAGAASCYLVCTRATEGYLGVGIKSSVISWLCVVLLTSVTAISITFEFILTILITFTLGGLVIAYYKQRRKLRNSIVDSINTGNSETSHDSKI